MSASVFIFILFADRNVEKEFRVQIASAVGGRRGEGAYRKPLLRISRYSPSEMDIFTEMDIFRKCKVFFNRCELQKVSWGIPLVTQGSGAGVL